MLWDWPRLRRLTSPMPGECPALCNMRNFTCVTFKSIFLLSHWHRQHGADAPPMGIADVWFVGTNCSAK